jgi:hypothetical protein
MPASSAILDSVTVIANDWRALAIGWHVYFLAALLLWDFTGRRLTTRSAMCLLIAPVASVSAVAWIAMNPFNGMAFATLAVALVAIAVSLPRTEIQIASAPMLATGLVLFVFGAVYPHFIVVDHWLAYTFAAPLGLLPCPTLLAVIGVTLMLRRFESTAWSIVLTTAGWFYGIVGVFALEVMLDYALIAAASVLAVATIMTVRWQSVRATTYERTRALPGDNRIPACTGALTHAITIERPASDIWPWLAQMGAGSRAGWYSYDVLDNGRVPSADRVIAELQQPALGTVFPALPGITDGFTLLEFEPRRHLILGWLTNGKPVMTWAFVLDPLTPARTRLIVRARASASYRLWRLPAFLSLLVARPVHFVMQRRQLLGIVARAERLAQAPFLTSSAA